MRPKLPDPPEHLRPETQAWWIAVLAEFEIEDVHQLALLRLAAEAFDRCQQAREALAEFGLTQSGRQGQCIARPEVAIERDSRLAYARLMRELALDVAPPDSRPPRRPGTK
jgi:phage terminase small subunit